MLEMLQTFASAFAIVLGLALIVVILGFVGKIKNRFERKSD